MFVCCVYFAVKFWYFEESFRCFFEPLSAVWWSRCRNLRPCGGSFPHDATSISPHRNKRHRRQTSGDLQSCAGASKKTDVEACGKSSFILKFWCRRGNRARRLTCTFDVKWGLEWINKHLKPSVKLIYFDFIVFDLLKFSISFEFYIMFYFFSNYFVFQV